MQLIPPDVKSRLAAGLERFPDIAASRLRFAEYLNGPAERPVGVAVSGGGDSVALLLLLWLWGQRPLEVFTVDHGINPLSADWVRGVEALGHALGVPVTALSWAGGKPRNGLQAAARRARHCLILEAARAKDIRVLCLGHNADDVAEAAAMRAEGSTVGSPKLWAPAPFWPQGEGMFYLRPLLGIGRARLRDWLNAVGVSYVDDPANANPTYLRARVRQQGVRPSSTDMRSATLSPDLAVAMNVTLTGAACFHIPAFPAPDMLSALIVCAGGGDKLPRQAELAHILTASAAGRRRFTLCGARIEAHEGGWLICREPGDMTRNGSRPERIGDIWDGRYRVPAYAIGGEIVPAKGHLNALPPEDRLRLKGLPPAVRAALPVLKHDESVHLFAAGDLQDVTYNRLRAALGLIRNEEEACRPVFSCGLPVA
ncbi:tRNA lysidine(34) synthetase TilS [Asticcacaulis sp. W401b]|uniref:tRNA lysidine(34) synthetase TilS n=1 Tax=Asticcacaulis sp. W401b TaxID=3388666 RepID=UPI0039707622